MNKHILLILITIFTFNTYAANVADFVEDGPVQTTGVGSDLSGVAYGTTVDGFTGEFTVDNKLETLYYPDGKSCFLGGDLEGVSMGASNGIVYTLNEAKDGVRELTVSSATGCTENNKFKVILSTGSSDGLEGVVYRDDWLYLVDERSAVLYRVPADSTGYSVSLETLFTIPSCFLASGLSFNGDNIVIACDNQDNAGGNGTIHEYTLDGVFVSQIDVAFTNVEGITFNGNQMIVTGEPNQIQYFTSGDGPIDPPPVEPTEETCTYSGEVVVNIDTGTWDAHTVHFVCPTLTVNGTLN